MGLVDIKAVNVFSLLLNDCNNQITFCININNHCKTLPKRKVQEVWWSILYSMLNG